MNSVLFISRTTRFGAIAGFVIGVFESASSVFTIAHIREFQSGEGSETAERLLAFAQRTALDALGFGLLAFLLSLLAVGLSPLLRFGSRTTDREEGNHAAGMLLLSSASFLIWITTGAWFAGEMLAYLSPLESLAVSAAGFFILLFSAIIFYKIVERFSFSFGASAPGLAFGSGVAICSVAWIVSDLLLSGGGAYRDPVRVAGCTAAIMIAFPAAAIIGAVATNIISAFREKSANGGLLPKPISLTIGALIATFAVVGAVSLDFSAVPGNVEYKKVASPGAPGGPNVIIITIDTQRADHLGCYGYKRPTSPFMDSLAAAGTVFTDCSAVAPWTKPSTATILTGLFPSRHGALYHGSDLNTPPGMKTLAETFQDKGYVTAGFVSNPNIKKIFKFDRGFHEFFDSPVEDTVTMATFRDSVFGNILKRLTKYQFNWKYKNDIAEVNRHLFSWLDSNHNEKFFLYLHYIDPHEPYSPPEPYRSQFTQEHGLLVHNERKRLMGIDLYDGEIRYTDEHIKLFAEKLKSYNLWDNTIVVITSDHGEEFFEHGVLGHGFSLYQEVIRIPLIFFGAGVAKGKRIDIPVSNVDLAPTLLDAAQTGIADLGDGKSFANLFVNQSVNPLPDSAAKTPREKIYLEDEFGENENDTRSFVMSGVRIGPWKLILNEINAYRPPELPKYPKYEFYNLETDSGEQNNLFKDESFRETIQKLVDSLLKHSEFLSEKGLRHIKPAPLSDAVMRDLRANGYLK
ncbi:MAG: sulfatase [Planctomycetota bacterium]